MATIDDRTSDVMLGVLADESKASQDPWEMYQLMRCVVDINPKVIVEIGVDGGGSLATWDSAFGPEVMIGIDINERAELAGYDMIFADSQLEQTRDELVRRLGNRPIDFLFLDGNHEYEFVKREFELYAPLVRPGGIIGFHDTNNRGLDHVQVDRFLAELDQSHSYLTADFRTDRMSPGTRVIWMDDVESTD